MSNYKLVEGMQALIEHNRPFVGRSNMRRHLPSAPLLQLECSTRERSIRDTYPLRVLFGEERDRWSGFEVLANSGVNESNS